MAGVRGAGRSPASVQIVLRIALGGRRARDPLSRHDAQTVKAIDP